MIPNTIGVSNIVMGQAFYLAYTKACGGTVEQEEKVLDDFDDFWQSTVGSGPDDLKYLKCIEVLKDLSEYLFYTLFSGGFQITQNQDLVFGEYIMESGIMIIDNIQGFSPYG